jgi:hypothetical protein
VFGEFSASRDGEFHLAERSLAVIDEIAGEDGHFLVQKICGAAQCGIFDCDLRGIRTFRRAKRRMGFLSSARRRLPARPQIKSRQHDDHGCGSDHQCETERAALWLLFPGDFDLGLLVHLFRVKRGSAIRTPNFDQVGNLRTSGRE